jgi:hypothetical protein
LGHTFHFIRVHINKNSNPIKKRRFAIRLKRITKFNLIGDQYCE